VDSSHAGMVVLEYFKENNISQWKNWKLMEDWEIWPPCRCP